MAIKNERIGPVEAVSLAVVFIAAKIYLTFPALMVSLGLSAAWMVVLLAVLISLPAFLPVAVLMDKYPGKSIIEIGEELVGPYLNTVFVLGYLAFLLAVESMVLRQFAERILMVSIPDLPISMAMSGMVLGTVMACFFGLEAIARSTRISSVFIGILLVLVLVATSPYWSLNNLAPIWGPGLAEVMGSGIMKLSLTSEIFLLAIIYPSINSKGTWNMWKLGSHSLIIAGLILVTTVITFMLTFPVMVAREISLPTFEMARLIYFGPFVQRLEPVFIPMWALAALLKLTIGMYAMLSLLTGLLKLPYYRPLILPLAIIIISVAFIPPNVTTAVMIDEGIIRTWGWVPTFGLPVILLAVSIWRRKETDSGGKKTS
jgi:spore germination protein (amino acid permease)